MLGDGAVGKSSILDRYISNTFEAKYRATIAIDYKNKSIELPRDSVHVSYTSTLTLLSLTT